MMQFGTPCMLEILKFYVKGADQFSQVGMDYRRLYGRVRKSPDGMHVMLPKSQIGT